ncbi:glycoside hydrolase family 19 protein [Vibrio hippocampi]|nr:glycoside hydrolase family 19 protein [Vibrio hippocampi]
MFNLNKLCFVFISAGILSGCGSDDSNTISRTAQTAPTIPVTIQAGYLLQADQARYQYMTDEDELWGHMSEEYQARITTYNNIALQYPKAEDTAYPGFIGIAEYEPGTIYDQSATQIRYTDGTRYGVFSNKWWTQGDTPDFDNQSGPWNLIVQTDKDGNYLPESEVVSDWQATGVYNGGEKVKHTINGVVHWFEAKYWTSNNEPILTKESGGTAESWETPWLKVEAPNDDSLVTPNPEDDLNKPPVCEEGNCNGIEEPTIPPVIPEPETPDPEKPEVTPTPPPTPDLSDDGLPQDGYAFLRELTTEQWDWLFPMRSGRYNLAGGTRNAPPFAKEDGSTDVFTLSAFKNAVVEYNSWAATKGYKQFLNEGTKSQQALEFTSFWAKSSRETSGSWDNAPAPWIIKDDEGNAVWKGALYWVEEVGYTTDDNGVSTAINYVDAASAYTPIEGRSYYGRGIIQLSWNYNYGAFSEWLFVNGMMTDLITERATLLKRPDYVATNGELSILSGIWFWMTPQGAKPSSHDVIYGNMTHISEFSQDQGLPQRNDSGQIPTAVGESYDQSVIAYRLGTVTNIVNGGLECNKAAAWHPGPVQRVAYFNAYAKYMNASVNGIDIPIINDGINVWSTKVSDSSPENLKMASCYSQKSYYGW